MSRRETWHCDPGLEDADGAGEGGGKKREEKKVGMRMGTTTHVSGNPAMYSVLCITSHAGLPYY